MAYASPVEALASLLEGSEKDCVGRRCWITWKPSRIRYDVSGIETYSIEVTCSNGIQYMIPAYGSEALELKQAAECVSLRQTPLIEA